MNAYRLCAAHRDPRDPTGATRWGGRWNSPGTALLYAASSLSLACLETLVHLRDPANLPALVYAEIDIPDKVVAPWREAESRTQAILQSLVLSREVGDSWIGSGGKDGVLVSSRTGAPVLPLDADPPKAAKQVPSAVVPQERNYLLDPSGSTYAQISWSASRPFRIDPRLIDPGLR